MRRFVAAAFAVCCLWVTVFALTPGPASAKGFYLGGVTVSGPGIASPINLTQGQFVPGGEASSPGWRLVGGLVNGVKHRPTPDTSALGGKYSITYTLVSLAQPRGGATNTDVIHQDLYPFAAGGPVAFTPSGQTMHVLLSPRLRPIASGWQAFPGPLIAILAQHGFSPAVGHVAPTVSRFPWLLTFGVLALLVIGVLVYQRHSKSRHSGFPPVRESGLASKVSPTPPQPPT